jgi:hypothetical protein
MGSEQAREPEQGSSRSRIGVQIRASVRRDQTGSLLRLHFRLTRRRERFTALLHHLRVDLLRDSFYPKCARNEVGCEEGPSISPVSMIPLHRAPTPKRATRNDSARPMQPDGVKRRSNRAREYPFQAMGRRDREGFWSSSSGPIIRRDARGTTTTRTDGERRPGLSGLAFRAERTQRS